jgi:hypothetical protein
MRLRASSRPFGVDRQRLDLAAAEVDADADVPAGCAMAARLPALVILSEAKDPAPRRDPSLRSG